MFIYNNIVNGIRIDYSSHDGVKHSDGAFLR